MSRLNHLFRLLILDKIKNRQKNMIQIVVVSY